MAGDREWRTLDEDTIRLHELYQSCRRSGFTEREGLYLTGLVMLQRLPAELLAQVDPDDSAVVDSLRAFLPDDPD